jgi:hypothetical protein
MKNARPFSCPLERESFDVNVKCSPRNDAERWLN